MDEMTLLVAKRIGISWVGLIALLVLWGMIYGSYMNGVEEWHLLAFVALFITLFVILDFVDTLWIVYGAVMKYGKRTKKL